MGREVLAGLSGSKEGRANMCETEEGRGGEDLDLLAMEKSQALASIIPKKIDAKDAENLFTKTLSILQENGVYSMMLYLMSQIGAGRKKDRECCIYTAYYALHLVGKLFGDTVDWTEPSSLSEPERRRNLLKIFLNSVCKDSDRTVLARTALERFLVYARFNAKALVGEGES